MRHLHLYLIAGLTCLTLACASIVLPDGTEITTRGSSSVTASIKPEDTTLEVVSDGTNVFKIFDALVGAAAAVFGDAPPEININVDTDTPAADASE